ncbi:MAG: hypothetical protein ACO3JL_01465 [Myxococcota bacterium]
MNTNSPEHRPAQRKGLFLPALCVGLSVFTVGACDVPTIAYELRFPSTETFLVTSTARVDVYDGAGTEDKSPDTICRALSIGQPAPVATLYSTGKRSVCAFAAESGLEISNVRTGRVVLFAEAEDSIGTKLLRGCSVVDLNGEVEKVQIQLSTLPTYPDDPEPSCVNAQQKCGGEGC